MGNVKHLAARSLIQQRLFDGITEFRDLEARITALETEQERGNAFEVFAEAYLTTQPVAQAKEVWPEKVIPPSLRKRLSLHSTDVGADGVIETQTGQLHGYQVKYRSHRASLKWTETATFFGVTDRCDQRFLFTNSDDVSAVMEQRKDFYCIRGNDLDKLEARDFAAMAAWLRGSIVPRVRKQPQPHQQEALDVILPALDKSDRATAIMACGTGKTLVALWVAERAKSRNVLVLVPSLALLRQTLHEWLRETQWRDFAYLCVCSDPTVDAGTDELIVRQADLDFPVTTDPGIVHRFLEGEAPAEPPVKIVFSTYQSAREVARGLPEKFAFDLAIFDEAHKTAGGEGRSFSFALEDNNLLIKKRLFLTATPRHYDVRKRDKEGDAKLVYSMDVPAVYGPVAHTLTFAEAARRDIICNYKVIISVVTSDMVNDHVLRHDKVLVKGDEIQARQVANQLALNAVVEKHGVSKIFTFHRSVASAKSFTNDGSEGIGNHLPDFRAFHVNGTMSTAEREGYMTEFRATPKAVMSNARCLTEGVDVPAVDMVAFLTPKRSKVDIVQATGRAMRKADGKTNGYILVPLFVEQAKGESIEEAVQRTEFDEVWNVLQAMREQDDVLADQIRCMAEQKARKLGVADTGFGDRVDFAGPALSLEMLKTVITTRSLEYLADSWDVRFGELKEFKEQFGHCNVEAGWEENPTLARWVSAQRVRQSKGQLYQDRIERLDRLGFVWDFQTQKGQETWMKWYRELENYRREHGNANVPRTWSDKPLASWVWIQRQRRRGKSQAGQLTHEQIALLEKLNFRWEGKDEVWAEMFEKLKSFNAKYGHCQVEFVLGSRSKFSEWAKTQRSWLSQGKLDSERKAMLNSIGFNWHNQNTDLKWREMYERLKVYHVEHGDVDVPSRWKKDPQLAAWLSHQRERRKKSGLSDEQIRLLDEVGITWQSRDVGTWEDRYQELIEFKAKHGHCHPPTVYPENPKLGRFINSMRSKRSSKKLAADRITRLEAIGFVWASDKWQTRFQELVRYKESHGNCDVPTRLPVNPQLSRWVTSQRQRAKSGLLSEEHRRQLDDIGFRWEISSGKASR